MVAYRWQLRKGGRKIQCPQCGQMRFVPYVSAADGVTLAGEEYGRCDREQSCGYHRYPSGVQADATTAPREIREERPIRFYPASVQVSATTNLFNYAYDMVGMDKAVEAWRMYKVGRDGERTVFWYISKDGEVRAGKSIPYGKDGHRIKTDKYPAMWLHKSKAYRTYFEGEKLQLCYFGEHLLKEEPDKPVAIVESEKTAILCSAYTDEWVWLASGGSQMIKNDEKNQVLKGRSVLLVPDQGQYWNWKEVADRYGWEITPDIERCGVPGADILDLVELGKTRFRKYNESKGN